MKQEAEQFRQWKASREKELLQVPLPFPFYFSLFSNDLRLYFYLIFKLTVTERREKERVWKAQAASFKSAPENGRHKIVTLSIFHYLWKTRKEKLNNRRFSCESKENYHSQVLQRKTEEAAMATKRLKELLEARKSSPREHAGMINNTLLFGVPWFEQ